jgi:putative PIN family toxin of toxin-antitoxin system
MPKRPRAVFDTNVLLSAILFGGIPLKLLDLWRHQDAFSLILSPEILAEVVSKLAVKFGFPDDLVQSWREILQERSVQVLPTYTTRICRDPEDDKFLDAALAGRAKYLVSGDRDLLTLEFHRGVQIITPSNFLKLLESRRRRR